MAAIYKSLDECSAEHPVFYEDEVDIHPNPKIGVGWQLRGQQKRGVTSRQDRMKNIIWLVRCIAEQVKSVMWVGKQ
ncbi:transposase [Klebsiella pneumoniae]|nr:transposase [Klebsiella pneumoniae]STX40221.1 transposase [Klebsiella pneumoniae]VTM75333.1 transposase [Klebsiella pneumoniae]